MLLNSSNLEKFGTMIGGAGLGAIFDGDMSTTGYAQSFVGYVGLVLSQAKRIARVDVTSATNGFDASGATSGIELRLYGKNGMPSGADDGVILASSAFTDQNTQRTITLESTDKISSFTHVWVKVHTGVWAVAADIKFYEETGPIVDLEPIGPGSHLIMKSCNDSIPLTFSFSEIPQFRVRFRLDCPRIVLFDLHADVIHVGGASDTDKPVGYSFRIVRRFGNDLPALNGAAFEYIDNAVGGGNVRDLQQHYGNKTIPSGMILEAGYHEVSVLGSGHTSATSTLGLLRMALDGYGLGMNCLRVVILP